MGRTIAVCIVAATAALLAGCAQTAWQRPGATGQDYAADMAACDQYVADNGDTAAFEARLHHSGHRANAARLVARHRQLHAHAGSRGHGHSGGNGGKGEATAEGVLIVAAVATTAAENAQLHDDCMIALGWTPATHAAPTVLAANNPTNLVSDAGTDNPALQTDYPALGFSVSEVTPVVADAENLDNRHGVLITAVVPGSPAAALGLAQGDVALFFNDNPIRTGDDVASAVGRASDELRGSIVLWRDREELRFTLASRGD